MMNIVVIKAAISIGALSVLTAALVWPSVVKADMPTVRLLAIAALPWLADIVKTLELPSGIRIEFQALQTKVDIQKQKIDALEFLFSHFVTAHEMHHLEALFSGESYPFERFNAFDAELRRLRSMGLIEGAVGYMPNKGEDLNAHMKITQMGGTMSLHAVIYRVDEVIDRR